MTMTAENYVSAFVIEEKDLRKALGDWLQLIGSKPDRVSSGQAMNAV